MYKDVECIYIKCKIYEIWHDIENHVLIRQEPCYKVTSDAHVSGNYILYVTSPCLIKNVILIRKYEYKEKKINYSYKLCRLVYYFT